MRMSDGDFVKELGRAMLAHRLRRASELLLDGYERWLPATGVRVPARALSTMMLLAEAEPLGVTQLAARLRLTHPLMIKLVAMLEAGGFVTTGQDPLDARRRPVSLTARGRTQADLIERALRIMDQAFAELCAEIGSDLPAALDELDQANRREPLERRLHRISQQAGQKENLSCA